MNPLTWNRLLAVMFVLNSATAVGGVPGGDEPEKPLPKVDVAFAVKIPLRDGVKLHATIYKPQALKKARPAIVTITPYTADSYHERGMYFAQHGYVFVIVDARGRGNSRGEFVPFAKEGKDGYDVVEWTAKQDWCNGRVGMWGGSYAGFNQWATLKEAPPHLKSIVPTASAHPGVDLPAIGGIVSAEIFRWFSLTSGLLLNKKLADDDAFWIAKFRKRALEHHPFLKLDTFVGIPNPHWRNWFQHREPDAFWDALVPSKDDYAKFDIPVLTITGHYDGDQPGAMAYYHRHMKYGSAKAKKKHYLIMGPWDHAGTRKPKANVGGVTFGKRSLLEMNDLHKAWYDWTLDEGFKPFQLTRRVMYYVSGLQRWKSVHELDDIPSERCKYYLDSAGQANDVFHSGKLVRDMPGKSPPDTYRYDPLDVRQIQHETKNVKAYLTDQRQALNLYGAGLVYHTPPIEQDMELTGYVKLVAWFKLNVPDTDFLVHLYAIEPDGRSILLTKDQLRARYRESLRHAKTIKPGKIERYEFRRFLFTSRLLQKGTRLRLVIRAPNSIYIEKNYNSGGRVETETAQDARTAVVTLYHDTDHPSHLEVPLVKIR